MFDPNTIQSVIAAKTKAGVEFALIEATDLAAAANTEASAFGDFAGALTKAKTPDEAMNAAISYNALAFQRATTTLLRAIERGSEYSKGCGHDIRKALGV
ncbi:hypothetical protein HFO56_23565 [Rhizobium laguerreae]|uniref:hypothetical protein n=1 Tax=Rhizobium laguerreae TaxID=1076926 RepID=UPI001C919998|nr:hypothetical protein [Rhizobium laguerreae]MBY3155305.1 hypothetical protein [Rhizobium laguerreae]